MFQNLYSKHKIIMTTSFEIISKSIQLHDYQRSHYMYLINGVNNDYTSQEFSSRCIEYGIIPYAQLVNTNGVDVLTILVPQVNTMECIFSLMSTMDIDIVTNSIIKIKNASYTTLQTLDKDFLVEANNFIVKT